MALFEAANVITDPDQLSASVKLTASSSINTIAVTSNVVTIDTTTPHFLQDGDRVVVNGTGTATFDGTFGPITVVKSTVTGNITSDGTNITFNLTSHPFSDGDYIIVTGSDNGASIAIDNITGAGTGDAKTATVTTEAAHGLSTGDLINISGATTNTDFNVTGVNITVTSTTAFTYTYEGTDISTEPTNSPAVADRTEGLYDGRFGPIINSAANTFQVASTINVADDTTIAAEVQDLNETSFTYADTQGDQAASADTGTVDETFKLDSEVFIDTTTAGTDADPYTVGVIVQSGGLVTKDGVTLKALYSFLKDLWATDDDLIKFPFPMIPITDEQFEFTNRWNLDTTVLGAENTESQVTNQLIRTGGWAVKAATGNDLERWVSVITLGVLDINDQVYYQYDDLVATNNTVNFLLTGPVNQAVQFYDDANADGTPDFNRNTNLTVYVRTWEKTYAQTNLADIGVTTVNSQAYRFPLTNAADVKITGLGISEAAAAGTNIAIDNITGDGSTATVTTEANHGLVTGDVLNISGAATNTDFNVNAVTITVTGDTTFTYAYTGATTAEPTDSPAVASGTYYNNMDMTWNSPAVQRPTSGVYNAAGSADGFAYHTVIIDGDAGGLFVGNEPSIEQIYAWTQAQLRRNADVDNGGTTKIGVVVPLKLQFIGDAIFAIGYTEAYSSQVTDFEGLAIDNFNNGDINNLHFWGYGSDSTTSFTITDATRTSGTVTITTSATHDYINGDYITITGTTGATDDFNGTFEISNVTGTTFDYTQAGADESETAAGTAAPAEFSDLTFPFSANLVINFGDNLVNDTDSIYKVFFTNDDAGSNTGRDYGTKDALVVNDSAGDPMTGYVGGLSQITLTYAYDTNTQRGNSPSVPGTPAPAAPITAVAIGLATAQYVSATATINRVESTTVSLISPLERNYQF